MLYIVVRIAVIALCCTAAGLSSMHMLQAQRYQLPSLRKDLKRYGPVKDIVSGFEIEEMPEDVAKVAAIYFGPDGRHADDYSFYFNNIKDNVAKRIAAYKANR